MTDIINGEGVQVDVGPDLLDLTSLRRAGLAWKRSRAYRTPPPVYAVCPSCRATVRVLPSGRWARHAASLVHPRLPHVIIRGRCAAGGRMADVAPCPDPECTRRGQHGDHWKLSPGGHLVKWADSP